MLNTWDKKIAPTVDMNASFEDNFIAINKYLEFENILCVITNLSDFTFPPANNKTFEVTDIKGPRTSYTKSLMQEWLSELPTLLDKFVQSDKSYTEITNSLHILKLQLEELVQKNDLSNELKYDENINWIVEVENNSYLIPLNHLSLLPDVFDQLQRHIKLRMLFFSDILKLITDKLEIHLTPFNKKLNLYSWESPNAELEISELIYVLYILKQKIRINENSGGSFAKFKKEIFDLFNLDSASYDKKVSQIKNRKLNQSFVKELTEALDKFHAKRFATEK